MTQKSTVILSFFCLIIFISGFSDNERVIYLKDTALIKIYETAIKANPEDYQLYYNLGNLYSEINNDVLAVETYQKCIKLNPEFYKAYNNAGYSYYKINNYKQAIESYKKCLILKGDYGITHYNLALAYYKENEFDRVIRHLKYAKYYNPELTEKVNNTMFFIPEI